ncbi:MAG TPA: hypothetical protein VD886_14585 [Herpetosiphonaceae bacterium]|nr:hypothetical protein [Herpetosiphonaceae bacterium]
MPTDEDIEHQKALLRTQRYALKTYLLQKARFTSAFVPPHILLAIDETRDEIRRLKSILAAWDVDAEDDPDDLPSEQSGRIHSAGGSRIGGSIGVFPSVGLLGLLLKNLLLLYYGYSRSPFLPWWCALLFGFYSGAVFVGWWLQLGDDGLRQRSVAALLGLDFSISAAGLAFLLRINPSMPQFWMVILVASVPLGVALYAIRTPGRHPRS